MIIGGQKANNSLFMPYQDLKEIFNISALEVSAITKFIIAMVT